MIIFKKISRFLYNYSQIPNACLQPTSPSPASGRWRRSSTWWSWGASSSRLEWWAVRTVEGRRSPCRWQQLPTPSTRLMTITSSHPSTRIRTTASSPVAFTINNNNNIIWVIIRARPLLNRCFNCDAANVLEMSANECNRNFSSRSCVMGIC